MTEPHISTSSSIRPPIVAVLGHVDHGKTTLLDFIRKTNVAAKEHGGITQRIGAYQIHFKSEIRNPKSETNLKSQKNKGEEHTITFIDTPGHEAFIKMRARGAKVADIALLVVAADDSVKPQTKESIRIIKEADIPMIVVVNKIDLPTGNVEKTKQDLARNEVQAQGFGGDVPIVLLSAKTGNGVPELLDTIIKLAKTLNTVNTPHDPFEAVVIETHVDKGKGMIASIIVKKGTLSGGVRIFEFEQEVAKVRAMFDEYGESVKEALPGKPVEVLGFTKLPEIGSVLRDIAVVKQELISIPEKKPMDITDFFAPESEQKTLNIILKADTAGSLEAVITSLEKGATIVNSGVGDVSDADVLMAKSTGAFIIGFNTKWKNEVAKLAETEGVVLRNYTIIYELLDELNEAISGMKEVLTKERELGKGMIIAEFPYDGKRVAGVRVTDGRLAKGDQVKILRKDAEIGRSRVKSLRKGKEDVTKAEVGVECGILFDGKVDFELSDAIIAFIRS